jgi:hypothetical protein
VALVQTAVQAPLVKTAVQAALVPLVGAAVQAALTALVEAAVQLALAALIEAAIQAALVDPAARAAQMVVVVKVVDLHAHAIVAVADTAEEEVTVEARMAKAPAELVEASILNRLKNEILS